MAVLQTATMSCARIRTPSRSYTEMERAGEWDRKGIKEELAVAKVEVKEREHSRVNCVYIYLYK